MIDVAPSILVPAWSNGRCGGGGIAKRLDRFFMAENMCDRLGRYRSWYHSMGVSNHKVMVFPLGFDKIFSHYPIKFNHTWIKVEYFNALVKAKWTCLSLDVP